MSDEKEVTLANCPFCGGAAAVGWLYGVGGEARVECTVCGCKGANGIGNTAFEAIAAWNRRAACVPARDGGDGPTHRHKKRGTEYVLIGVGRMQAEGWFNHEPQPGSDGCFCTHHPDDPAHGRSCYDPPSVDMREVVIYRSVDDGSLWVRPREEFEDGRFEPITASPDSEKGEGRG